MINPVSLDVYLKWIEFYYSIKKAGINNIPAFCRYGICSNSNRSFFETIDDLQLLNR